MKIGIPKEIHPGERRVASTPEVVAQLSKPGFSVAVEAAANFSDQAYAAADCQIVASTADLWAQSDILLKVQAPDGDEARLLKSGQTLTSFLWPAQPPDMLKDLTDRGVTRRQGYL